MILPREIYVQVQYTVMLISWKVCPGENPLDLRDHNYIGFFLSCTKSKQRTTKEI